MKNGKILRKGCWWWVMSRMATGRVEYR